MFKLLRPKWFVRFKIIYKKRGWKGLFKEGGIKFVMGFILFYLIRDTLLYIVPFYFGIQGVQSCF